MPKRSAPPPAMPPDGRLVWEPGDPGYEPVQDPPLGFFHVIVAPEGTDEKLALVIHAAYEGGRDLGALDGRRYLVNAVDEADARAQVERLETQIAENDPLHRHVYGKKAWPILLVVPADAYGAAGRDSEPAEPHEALAVDPDLAARRKQRAIAGGKV